LESQGKFVGCVSFTAVWGLFPDDKDDTDENDLNQFS